MKPEILRGTCFFPQFGHGSQYNKTITIIQRKSMPSEHRECNIEQLISSFKKKMEKGGNNQLVMSKKLIDTRF